MNEQDKTFYRDGYRLVLEYLSSGQKKELLYQAIQNKYEAIDELINALFVYAEKQSIHIDCKKGCASCCKQTVFASSHEFDYLNNYIRKHFSMHEISEIKQKSDRRLQATKDYNQESILNHREDCPLLKDNSCMAYEARPMACRIYLSTSADTCIKHYKTPGNDSIYPALLDFPLRAGQMINEGFIAALKSGNILNQELRMEEGLSIVLK